MNKNSKISKIKEFIFLKNYKKYKDNQLGDSLEGQSMNFLNSQKDNKHVGLYTTVGQNAYCFCTSTMLDENLKNTFSRNSVFKINDPLNFMLEIQNP